MTPQFVRSQRVHFCHCDPAGIVFYPRYFELITAFQDYWFTEGLGIDYAALHLERGITTPTVHLDCTFTRPSFLGEDILFTWTVKELGRSSVTCAVTLTHADELRLRAEIVLVFVDRETRRSIPVPDDVRRAIERYLPTPDQDKD